jgi:PAS domain S-box-containing protein
VSLPVSSPSPDFKALFEGAPGLYLVLLPDDPKFTIVAVSAAYLAATMTERDRIVGRGLFEVFPDNPADPDATGVRNLHASLKRVLLNRAPDAMALQKYDIRRPEAEGGEFEERYWSPLNSPVLDSSNEVSYIIHRVEDVTEFVRLKQHKVEQEKLTEQLRVRSEQMEAEVFARAQQVQEANRQLSAANEELSRLREQDSARAREALERSEKRYRTLVSATTSVVWTRSADGGFVEPQPSWSAFTGQSWDEYKGWGWLQAIHPEDRERFRERWLEVLNNPQPLDLEGRIWSRQRNGYCRFVGRSAPVMSTDGAVQEWIGTITDIEDQKRLEEQLRHAAKLESLGVLAGGIAHDFNNLLTGILGNASQAIEVFAPRNPGDRAILENIVSAGERAAHLTRQMLAYSGKGAFQIRDIDLTELVRGISTLVRSSIPKNVHLRLELEDRLPCIEADPGQLQQVVMNLIINGGEAVPADADGFVVVTTGAVEVDNEYAGNFDPTYSLKPGRYVSLEVHDTGVGMSEEVRRKIFDPFFTTKVHGRGLGLSAVLGIVRGHKGALRVYTEPGHGTTFKVLFPAAKPSVEKPARVIRTVRRHGAGTILVIDDEAVVRSTVKSALEYRGYSVILAEDGIAGVQHFRTLAEQLVLVILDLTMPKMSGEETLGRLRSICPGVPVILSSGYNQVEATRKFLGKGLASFLQKPYTVSQLVEAVEGALNPGISAGQSPD